MSDEPQEPLDAEVVYDEIATDKQGNLPSLSAEAVANLYGVPPDMVGTADFVAVRMVPSGRECWWRLYSTPTSYMRGHQDHGVLAVYARRENPHVLVLDLEGHGRHELSALAWRVNQTDPSRTGQTELGEGKAQPPAKPGPDSLDLLVEFPPELPGKQRHWQQMTQPGQLRHPGDNRMDWRFYDWWQGGTGVRFEPGDTWPPGDQGSYDTALQKRWHRERGMTDGQRAGEGFVPLGYTKGVEKKDDS